VTIFEFSINKKIVYPNMTYQTLKTNTPYFIKIPRIRHILIKIRSNNLLHKTHTYM